MAPLLTGKGCCCRQRRCCCCLHLRQLAINFSRACGKPVLSPCIAAPLTRCLCPAAFACLPPHQCSSTCWRAYGGLWAITPMTTPRRRGRTSREVSAQSRLPPSHSHPCLVHISHTQSSHRLACASHVRPNKFHTHPTDLPRCYTHPNTPTAP